MNSGRQVMLAVLVWASLCAIAAWQARAAVHADIDAELSAVLPERFHSARVNLEDGAELNRFIASRLDEDLRVISVQGWLPLLRECRGRVLAMNGLDFAAPVAGEYLLNHSLPPSVSGETLTLAVHCRLNWPGLLISQGALTAVLLLLMNIILLLSSEQRALLLLRWLRTGWRDQGSMAQALSGRSDDALLVLDPVNKTLHCRGIPVHLSSTPFFYYYWYACRRQQGEGWYANPPAERADYEAAAELVSLLQRFGGHTKAINDLNDKGLRAKKLDQNRSKAKEEIVAVLGETLAEPFLFEMRRDPRTARYDYRLSTAPERIRFIETGKRALSSS